VLTNRQAKVVALANIAHGVNIEISVYYSLSCLRYCNGLQLIRRDLDYKGNNLARLTKTTLRDLDAGTVGSKLS
jgi:hypothetical protein